jgi:aryl-alcohol dehydrogenase-like predicted oxidoreductase
MSRPWGSETVRTSTDNFGKTLYHQDEESARAIINAVGSVADARGVPRAQVALAWARQQPAVTAPIVGVTREKYLYDAIASVHLHLEPEELKQLEDPYTPRKSEF